MSNSAKVIEKEIASSRSTTDNPAATTWLQDVANSVEGQGLPVKKRHRAIEEKTAMSTRKTRIQGILSLLIQCEEITFNTSISSFNLSSASGSVEEYTGRSTDTTLDILTFLRDLQIYQKRVPESYFLVLILLFPATSHNSVQLARNLIVNRNCLSHIINRNVHQQRSQHP